METPSADVSHVDLDSIRTAHAEDDSIKVIVEHLSAGADPGDRYSTISGRREATFWSMGIVGH